MNHQTPRSQEKLWASDQFLTIQKCSIPLTPTITLPFQNPAALLLAAKGKAQRSEVKIGVIVNHPKVFMEGPLRFARW